MRVYDKNCEAAWPYVIMKRVAKGAFALFLESSCFWEGVPMKYSKHSRRLLVLLTSAVFGSGLMLQLPAEAAEPPAGSAFSQTLSSLFSDSSLKSDQIYAKISALKNDYSVLETSDPTDSPVIEQLIQNFESEKAQYFLSGTCAQKTAVRTAWDLEKQYMLFGFSGNEQFLQFIPKVYVTDVSVSGRETSVGIYEWMTVRYADTKGGSTSLSGYGYSFTLRLSSDASKVKDSGSSFSVSSIEDTDQNFTELKQEGVNITASGISYQKTSNASDAQDDSEDALVGSSSEGSSDEAPLVGADSSVQASWAYNTENAVSYADKWALGRNSTYTWWGDDGGDCSNFVSQCLYAGGFPKTSSWYPDASSWIGQNELRDYLLQIGAGKLLTKPSSSDVKKGDLIWYNWDGQGTRTNHVTICVGTNSSGVPVIDSHTSARYHYKWNYGGSNATYMVMQMKSHSSDYVPVYRMYNKNSGEHFYTGSEKERDYLQKSGWRYEGLGWVADNSNTGTVIYRLYNPHNGDHHYTAGYKEMMYLKNAGWKYEGQLCKTVKKSDVPLYRLYNPNAKTGAHHYTKSKKEAEYLEKLGWKYEGIAWYSKV